MRKQTVRETERRIRLNHHLAKNSPGNPLKVLCVGFTVTSRRSCSYLVLPRRLEPLSALTAPVGNTRAHRDSGAGEPLGPAPHARQPPAAGDTHRGPEGGAQNPGPRAHVGRHPGTGVAPCEQSADPAPCVLRDLASSTLPGSSSHSRRRRTADARRRHSSATTRASKVGVSTGCGFAFADYTRWARSAICRDPFASPSSSSSAPAPISAPGTHCHPYVARIKVLELYVLLRPLGR